MSFFTKWSEDWLNAKNEREAVSQFKNNEELNESESISSDSDLEDNEKIAPSLDKESEDKQDLYMDVNMENQGYNSDY